MSAAFAAVAAAIEDEVAVFGIPTGSLDSVSRCLTRILKPGRRVTLKRTKNREGVRAEQPQGFLRELAGAVFEVRTPEQHGTGTQPVSKTAVVFGGQSQSTAAVIVADQRKGSIGARHMHHDIEHLLEPCPHPCRQGKPVCPAQYKRLQEEVRCVAVVVSG